MFHCSAQLTKSYRIPCDWCKLQSLSCWNSIGDERLISNDPRMMWIWAFVCVSVCRKNYGQDGMNMKWFCSVYCLPKCYSLMSFVSFVLLFASQMKCWTFNISFDRFDFRFVILRCGTTSIRWHALKTVHLPLALLVSASGSTVDILLIDQVWSCCHHCS